MNWDIREIISRSTMALLAIALAWAATWLLTHMTDPATGMSVVGYFVPIAVLMYALALLFGCFVFASRDPRKARLGRVMTIGDWVSRIVSGAFDLWTDLL